MVRKTLLKLSLVSGFLLFSLMHIYYPHDPSVIIGRAALPAPSGKLDLSSTLSFSFAMLVEYLVVVFIVYLFFRSVATTFERRMRKTL